MSEDEGLNGSKKDWIKVRQTWSKGNDLRKYSVTVAQWWNQGWS